MSFFWISSDHVMSFQSQIMLPQLIKFNNIFLLQFQNSLWFFFKAKSKINQNSHTGGLIRPFKRIQPAKSTIFFKSVLRGELFTMHREGILSDFVAILGPSSLCHPLCLLRVLLFKINTAHLSFQIGTNSPILRPFFRPWNKSSKKYNMFCCIS
jgi:hypothetical protein